MMSLRFEVSCRYTSKIYWNSDAWSSSYPMKKVIMLVGNWVSHEVLLASR